MVFDRALAGMPAPSTGARAWVPEEAPALLAGAVLVWLGLLWHAPREPSGAAAAAARRRGVLVHVLGWVGLCAAIAWVAYRFAAPPEQPQFDTAAAGAVLGGIVAHVPLRAGARWAGDPVRRRDATRWPAAAEAMVAAVTAWAAGYLHVMVDAALAVVADIADAVAGTWLALPLGLVGGGLTILVCWLVVRAILRLSVRFVGPDNLLVTYAPMVEVDVSVDVDVGDAHFDVGSDRLAFRTAGFSAVVEGVGTLLQEVRQMVATALFQDTAPAASLAGGSWTRSDLQKTFAREARDRATAAVGDERSRWQTVRLDYRALGNHEELDLLLITTDGERRFIDPGEFTAGREALRALRAHDYRHERGTWFVISRSVHHDGESWIDPSGHQRPRWTTPPEPEHYLQEMARFPRRRAETPGWFRVHYRRASHPWLARASDATAMLCTIAAWTALALLAIVVLRSPELPPLAGSLAGGSLVHDGSELAA